MFIAGRDGFSLDGLWKFNPDPYQRCRQQQWWKNPPSNNSFFPCWDPQGLWDIQVPGTWKTQFTELKWYDGHANYMKDFSLTGDLSDKEVFLHFDSVVYASDVYLNGHHVAHHGWGYSPFVCRVTDYIRPENRLFVLVDNHLRTDRVPGIRFDWNNDGGIVSSVRLVVVPKTYIQNFRTWIQLDLTANEAQINVELLLMSRDTSAQEDVIFSIPELGIESRFVARCGLRSTVSIKLPLSAMQLWCPENPKLYIVKLSTRHETLQDEIGYREVRTEGKQLLLNGKPIRLYGVCIHSEFPETGRTATADGISKVIAHIKELGCNFVRCAHYPYPEIWGRAMDKAGLLWWEEVPVYWLPTIHHEDMTAKALGMLQEMIKRDWNRASLIIWSVSNECAGDAGHSFDLSGGNYPYWVKACRLVRQLDSSRLISSADSGHRRTLGAGWSPDKADAFVQNFSDAQWIPGHPDAFYDLLDILSGNVYVTGEGEGKIAYDKYVQMLEKYNKPLMISEFGFMSLRGSDQRKDVSSDTLGSEKRHIRVMQDAYQSFARLPEITGYMPWCLTDVRVPMHWRWYNDGQAVFRYGLIDETGQKKLVFDVVKNEIKKLKMIFENNP